MGTAVGGFGFSLRGSALISEAALLPHADSPRLDPRHRTPMHSEVILWGNFSFDKRRILANQERLIH
jgi:hypothetical protein